jgi:hypothetical protein
MTRKRAKSMDQTSSRTLDAVGVPGKPRGPLIGSSDPCPCREPHPAGMSTRSARLTRNDRVSNPARPRPGLAIQDAGAIGSGDCAAAASIECAAPARALEAEADGGGSTALRLALSAVSVGVERRDDCPTGDGYPMASVGVPTVLALEVAQSGRSAEDTVEVRRLIREMSMANRLWGCAPHPWRTAQARDGGRAVDGRQVHGEGGRRPGRPFYTTMQASARWTF